MHPVLLAKAQPEPWEAEEWAHVLAVLELLKHPRGHGGLGATPFCVQPTIISPWRATLRSTATPTNQFSGRVALPPPQPDAILEPFPVSVLPDDGAADLQRPPCHLPTPRPEFESLFLVVPRRPLARERSPGAPADHFEDGRERAAAFAAAFAEPTLVDRGDPEPLAACALEHRERRRKGESFLTLGAMSPHKLKEAHRPRRGMAKEASNACKS